MSLFPFFSQSSAQYAGRADILPPQPAIKDAGDVAKSYARIFSTEDGRRVLDHLQISTFHRATGPDTSDAHIRHLEGQRYLLSQILRFIERGKGR